MKRITKRSLSMILSILMIFHLFPYGASGNKSTKSISSYDPVPEITDNNVIEVQQEEPPYVLYEEENLREERVKHYRMSNGSFAAVEFPYSVHYENEDKSYSEIDNTLIKGEDGYSNRENDVNYTFSTDTDTNEILDISYGSYELEIDFTGVTSELPLSDNTSDLETKSKSSNKSIEIINPEDRVTEEKNGTVSAFTTREGPLNIEKPSVEDVLSNQIKNESSIKYINITKGIDLRYDISGNELKEYIILKEKPEGNIFSFNMKLDGLIPVLNNDKSVSICDKDFNRIFMIPAPFMTDASGVVSYDCEYIIEESGEGISFKISANKEWLDSEDRSYPVMIDPALNVTGEDKTNAMTTSYYAAGANTVNTAMQEIYMGYDSWYDGEYIGYLKVNTLPAIPYGASPVKAYVYLGHYAYDGESMESLNVSARAVTGNTWYTQYSNTVLDYTVLSDDTVGEFVSWDISDAAKGWYIFNSDPEEDNALENKGIVFVSEHDLNDSYNAKATLYGFHNLNFNEGCKPKFVVYYQNMIGMEQRYSSNTQNIGRAGTGNIRAYDADLTLLRNDASFSSTAMSFTVSHIYNTKYHKNHFTSNGTVLNTKNYDQMFVGKGWKLNLQQTVVEKQITDINGNAQSYLIYTDEDGTEHYFNKDPDNNTRYIDEEGMDLTAFSENGEWIIKSEKDVRMYFCNGYLYKIEDANGNYVEIYYGDSAQNTAGTEHKPAENRNRILEIKQTAAGGTTKSIARFSYASDNFLYSVTDIAGRRTTIEYTGIGQIDYFKDCDGVRSKYIYDSQTSAGKLISAYDSGSGYGIDYAYKGLSVVAFNEFCSNHDNNCNPVNKTTGASYWYNTSGDKVTYFRYSGADRTLNTADDIVTTYLFDDYARTVNCYSANTKITDGTQAFSLYGTGAAAYTPTSISAPEKNNRISAETSSGRVAVNLLMNPSAEGNGSYWQLQNGGSLNSVLENVRSGEKSIKLKGTGAYACQTRQIKSAGKHTASAYLRVMGAENEIPEVYLYVSDQQGNLTQSRTIRESTSNGQWERLSVTFDAQANKNYGIYIKTNTPDATVYADDLQLEAGDGASRPGLLSNGGFEHSDDKWTLASGVGTVSTDKYMPGSQCSYKLTAGAGTQSQITQTTAVNSANSAETFVLSGWAWADSIPVREGNGDESKLESKFKLFAKVSYTDTSIGDSWYRADFNPDIRNEWQFLSLMIVPKHDAAISSITVGVCYANNNGSAYLDNLSLIREDVQTYSYDEEGNLIQAGSSASEEKASYSYDGADLISAAMPGSGTCNYTYKQTGNTHLAETVTCDDLKMSLEYSAAGTNTLSTLESTSNTSGKKICSSASYSADGDHVSYSEDANGISASYSYDNKNQLSSSAVQSSETLSNGDVTTNYTYDSIGRSKTTYISGKISLDYSYTDGMLTGITRGGYIPGNSTKQSQSYSFVYDEWGNTAQTRLGDDTMLASYEYAPNNGNLIKMTYGNGAYIEYEYDNLDRIVKVSYNGIERCRYSFNGDGALYKVTEGTKSHYYNYDGIGRLVSLVTYENGTVTDYQSFGYDEHGRTSSVTEKFGCNEVKDSYTYNESNGLVTSVTQQYHAGYKNSTNTFSYSYDHLKRADSTTVAHDGKSYSVNYRYANNLKDSAYTSNLINRKSYGTSVYESDAYKFDYVYDRGGNIKTATVTSKYDSNYVYTVRYGYDEQNQLVSERCAATNRAYVYEYDTYGNIRSKKTYTYGNYADPEDIAANCTLLSTDVYEYDDYEWFDLLTEYNNVPFSHDIIGNPLTYYNGSNYTFTWQNGRQMASASVNGTNLSFEYDIDGLRTKKTVQNGETYNYYYSGNKLHAMTWENGTKMLSFLYDSSGAPYSMVYCYTESGVKYSSSYYYVTNLQGDVIALMNANHEIVAEYLYDAWGNILSVTNANGTDLSGNATHIANLNPLRYRGYVYDNETGFYYLQSRYYDPVIGRFINLDGFISTDTGFLGHNMFAYCNNNSVMFSDHSGCLSIALNSEDIKTLIEGLVAGISAAVADGPSFVADIVGAGIFFVAGVKVVSNVKSRAEEETEEREKISDSVSNNKSNEPIIFPVDPNLFCPRGLIKVPREGSKNGKLISWMSPVTNVEVFRWDENTNFSNGPHYHIYGSGHYAPGTNVPEPYATLYFSE